MKYNLEVLHDLHYKLALSSEQGQLVRRNTRCANTSASEVYQL